MPTLHAKASCPVFGILGQFPFTWGRVAGFYKAEGNCTMQTVLFQALSVSVDSFSLSAQGGWKLP